MEGAPPRRWPTSWSDIPVELAGLFLERLPAHVDRVRFAAVCPQWRAAARQEGLAPPMPLLLLPDATVYSLPGSKPFSFPDCAGYADACGNWLVFSGEDDCFLKDPFSNTTVTLPALSRIRVQYVGQDVLDQNNDLEFDEIEKLDPCKIMFCSPDLIAAIGFTAEDTWIAVCRPGATSWWSVRAADWTTGFADIVFYQGKLYVLDYKDRLCAVDISVDHSTGDPCVSQIQQVMGSLQLTTNNSSEVIKLKVAYLVESRGALLVVCRRRRIDFLLIPGNPNILEAVAEHEVGFEVFEANFGQSRWAKVTTLGDDQVLFLRRRCCRSICVSCDEVPGDCIYFMENDYEEVNPLTMATSSSCSVYSMRDDKISTALPTVSWNRGTVFATWLSPQN